ncbi:MAG TPA: PIN domain-containing protein [Bryobacteraceae bacterium]|nr:PIN domain-containing protein [Bryobacteraceae bacterium]
MSVEFIDTNILIYAHDGKAGVKHNVAAELLTRLVEDGVGALSMQVLSEFYAVATQKLGRKSEEAERIIGDLSGWSIHRPAHADLLRAVRLHRRYKTSWWDALIINSAIELGCSILWSEDLNNGQRYETVRVRNPFV